MFLSYLFCRYVPVFVANVRALVRNSPALNFWGDLEETVHVFLSILFLPVKLE